VGNSHPAAPLDLLQPFSIGTIGREVICVSFYSQAGVGKDFRKLFSKIVIGEKRGAHAARS
jgi:hypothetical protein